MRRALLAGVMLALGAGLIAAPPVGAQTRLTGTVLNAQQRPIPGLTVSLAHPRAGRSNPVFTDASGRFTFHRVPDAPPPWYLEIYWGRDLLYRRAVTLRPPALELPPIVLR